MGVDIQALAKALRGRFVVLDGPDGAGKSTQHELLAAVLGRTGLEVVSCRDPGGTTIGNRIRSILLDHDLSAMDVNCETMLFMASRAQLLADVVRPALQTGKTVLCDRFVTSTCAYQGAAGYDPRRVVELARYALDDSWPDVTVVLDVPADTGLARIGRKPRHAGKNRRRHSGQQALFTGDAPDAMEARPLAFHRRVRELFLEVPKYYPTPVKVVSAEGSPPEVHALVLEALADVVA